MRVVNTRPQCLKYDGKLRVPAWAGDYPFRIAPAPTNNESFKYGPILGLLGRVYRKRRHAWRAALIRCGPAPIRPEPCPEVRAQEPPLDALAR